MSGQELLICTLNMFQKVQKELHRTSGPTIAFSLEPQIDHQNAVSSSLFCGYYFGRCSPEFANMIPMPYSRWSSTFYVTDCMISQSPFVAVLWISILTNFCLAQLDSWNSLRGECSPLMYDLNSFKSKIIKPLLKSKLSFFYGLFLMNFSVCFLSLSFFFTSITGSGCSPFHRVNPN